MCIVRTGVFHRLGVRVDEGVLIISLGWLLISFGSDAQRRRIAGK